MARWLAMIVAALVLAGAAASAGAQPKAPKEQPKEQKQKEQKQKEQKQKEQKKKESSNPKTPLHLYLAKGEPNACGDGCSEWIAIEGSFDSDAAGRAQAFLKRHAARKLPVYFHSPGGNTTAAMALGRQLRQLGITAGVAATIPRGCESAFDQSKACSAAKRSGQPAVADWRPDVACSSACVWALLGAKVRQVAPGARLGVHAGKLTLMRKSSDGRVQELPPGQYSSLHKSRSVEMVATTRRYMREMGIDTAVLDMAQKVPHEDVYYLTRDEIAAFGIDRRDFAETPWFFAQFSNNNAYVSKWIAEARGPGRKEHRVSVVLLRCASASRASLQYIRGLASDEIGRAATATFSIGKQKARLALSGGGSKRDTIDTGGLFASGGSYVSFADIEAAAASDAAIRVTESDPRLDTKLYSVIELSSHGLAAAFRRLQEKCAQSAQAPTWVEGTSVPFVDDQATKKSPWSPAGIYLQPDWKPPERPKR